MITGNRATSGVGTAIYTPDPITESIRFGPFVQLQLNEAGPVVIILKFGKDGTYTTFYKVTLQSAGDGVLLTDFPVQTSKRGESLYVDLSSSKSVDYVFDVSDSQY